MNWSQATFERCLAASLILHVALFVGLKWVRPPAGYIPLPVEVDLNRPLMPGGPAKLGAPKRSVPEAGKGPALPAEEAKTPETVVPPSPAKDWTLPGPETKAAEKLPEPGPTPGGTPEGTGTASQPGGSGVGENTGAPSGTGIGGASLLKLPQLLNRDEVLANLRRFYPEPERRAGREGSVLLILHIGTDGRVGPVEVLESAGAAFDKAAMAVAFLMRFSPAEGPKGPVPVRINQSMVFRLED